MSRRRNRVRNRRKKRQSPWLIGAQLFIMAAVLIFIFVYRDYLADAAGKLISAFNAHNTPAAADATDQPRTAPSQRATPRLQVIHLDAGPDAGTTDANSTTADTPGSNASQ